MYIYLNLNNVFFRIKAKARILCQCKCLDWLILNYWRHAKALAASQSQFELPRQPRLSGPWSSRAAKWNSDQNTQVKCSIPPHRIQCKAAFGSWWSSEQTRHTATCSLPMKWWWAADGTQHCTNTIQTLQNHKNLNDMEWQACYDKRHLSATDGWHGVILRLTHQPESTTRIHRCFTTANEFSPLCTKLSSRRVKFIIFI